MREWHRWILLLEGAGLCVRHSYILLMWLLPAGTKVIENRS